jgi:hypothetical protein
MDSSKRWKRFGNTRDAVPKVYSRLYSVGQGEERQIKVTSRTKNLDKQKYVRKKKMADYLQKTSETAPT